MTSMSHFALLMLCATAILAVSSASAARDAPAPLLKEATVSESQATAIALAKVPHGLVKIYGLPLRCKQRLSFWIRIGLRQIYPASDASVDAGPDDIRSQEPRKFYGVGAAVQTIRLILRRSDLLPSASTL